MYKNNNIMETQKQLEIKRIFEEKGCRITSDIINKSIPITYICVCGEEKTQLCKDFVRRDCRSCKTKRFKDEDWQEEEKIDENNGEIWKRIQGGWISSLGNFKNIDGKLGALCPEKFRYNVMGKAQYASRLVAIAFKIPGYEKLSTQSFVVHNIDNDKANNNINNLIIISKTEVGSENGKKSHKSDNFQDKMNLRFEDFETVERVVINLLPNHTIFKNGEIWNGTRFITGSKSKDNKYIKICLTDAICYYINRLVCFAFNKLENKLNYEDYEGIEVNHKDGNTLNNHADNLEWVSHNENMSHSYATGLNKKQRIVLQYNRETNEFIAEYRSIAEASRQTGDKEHQIRTMAQGKKISTGVYRWEFKDESKTKEFSRKYSHK